MQCHDRRESLASVLSLSKTFGCGDQPNGPEGFGREGRLPRSRRWRSSLGSAVPSPAHPLVGPCLGRARMPARGKECWVAFPPLPQLRPTTHAGAVWGISLSPPLAHVCPGTGLPERTCAVEVGAPAVCRGASFASQRKLINTFANPPLELYRWLVFIEVVYLEHISLKSVLMFAKIHAVPIPSCVRLLAPFSSQRFLPVLLQEPNGETHRAGRLKM